MSVMNHSMVKLPQYVFLFQGSDGQGGGRELINKKKIDRCFYVLQAKYLSYVWDVEICGRKKEVSNFRPLTPSELHQYRTRQLPSSQIINWQ